MGTSANTVDLKYITCAQILEVAYEGRRRRFSIISISSQRSPTEEQFDEFTHEFESLSVASSVTLWKVGWDCTVSTVDKIDDQATTPYKVLLAPRNTPQPIVLMTYHVV